MNSFTLKTLTMSALVKFNQEQIDLIKSQIAPKATDDELKLFIYQCNRTGLDPLGRQIYAIHRWNKQQNKEVMTIQPSIDGFRVIAERSKDYGGQDEPVWGQDEKGESFCKVTVYKFRGDTRYPAAVGVAYWKEYVQTDKEGRPSGLWAKMPRTMLAKVAEALALRKAFPDALSGLYTGEEMQQADNGQPLQKAPETPLNAVHESDKAELRKLAFSASLTDDERKAELDAIDLCGDYKTYQSIQYRLENLQPSFDEVVNPSATDVKRQVRRIAKPA